MMVGCSIILAYAYYHGCVSGKHDSKVPKDPKTNMHSLIPREWFASRGPPTLAIDQESIESEPLVIWNNIALLPLLFPCIDSLTLPENHLRTEEKLMWGRPDSPDENWTETRPDDLVHEENHGEFLKKVREEERKCRQIEEITRPASCNHKMELENWMEENNVFFSFSISPSMSP